LPQRRTHLFITAIQPLASMPNATSTVKLTATRHGHAAATCHHSPNSGGDIGKNDGNSCNTCHTWHAHTAARSRWYRTVCKPGTPPISHNLSTVGCVSLSMGGRIANESWEKACAQCGGRHASMNRLKFQTTFLTTAQAWCEV
jgi:hypothetical protein